MAFDAANVLSGAWVYVSVVTDMGGTSESETIVGYVHDEKTLSNEMETAEWNFSEQEATVRLRTHSARDFEFMVAVTKDLDALQTLGLVDTSGTTPELVNKNDVDLRLDVFREKPSDPTATSDLQLDCADAEVAWSEMALPQDGSSITIPTFLNGPITAPNITTS